MPGQRVMYDVVPGALLRLREADIVSLAGLTIASVGQKYCRTGSVHSTKRQEARLFGIVDVSDISSREAALHTNGATKATEAESQSGPGRYNVEVEVRDGSSWIATCTCDQHTPICTHAAALLYQWVSHPTTFTSTHASQVPSIVSPVKHAEISRVQDSRKDRLIASSTDSQDNRRGLSAAERSAFQSLGFATGWECRRDACSIRPERVAWYRSRV